MNSAIERLLGLRVKDVMNKQVITVSQSDSMNHAASVIYDNQITGVPVVDARGGCVGVISASDFVGWDAGRHKSEILVQPVGDGPYEIDCVNDQLVDAHMSPMVQLVSAEATILSAARLMCNEGIHRLVVADEDDRPIGIISTLDLVASMVAAVDER